MADGQVLSATLKRYSGRVMTRGFRSLTHYRLFRKWSAGNDGDRWLIRVVSVS